MTKKEVVWLIIRLIGVYFAYLTVVSFLSIIGSIYNYASLPAPTPTPRANTEATRTRPAQPPLINNQETELPAPVRTEIDAVGEKTRSEAFKMIFWFVFLTVLYGLLSWYLIRDGKYLFAVLLREDKNPEEEKKEPQVTSLNL